MPVLLGCIADDFTGATDLCNTLVRGGMRTVQLIGVPAEDLALPEADAVTVALKSRSEAPEAAVTSSLAALRWLQRAGARQIFFKYCSTFDSTDRGNIGPVGDALLEALGAELTIACPAFPETGRTVYQGHLFVGDRLLSETHMRHHPLTPMTDSDLVRVLGRQSARPVGLVPWATVRAGAGAIRERLQQLSSGYAVVDAVEDEDLRQIAAACADLALVTGGSGVAMGLPENFRAAGRLGTGGDADALPPIGGAGAVLAGSCSAATLGQVEAFARSRPVFRLDPLALADGLDPMEAVDWAASRLGDGPVLIAASAPAEQVAAAQERLGRERAGSLVEGALAHVARGLVEGCGVRRLVVAGGETSGAVVQALGVRGLVIGPQIDPGVPATVTLGREPQLALALKSGNFGAPDFFLKALERMA